jgi:hypothetical protein
MPISTAVLFAPPLEGFGAVKDGVGAGFGVAVRGFGVGVGGGAGATVGFALRTVVAAFSLAAGFFLTTGFGLGDAGPAGRISPGSSNGWKRTGRAVGVGIGEGEARSVIARPVEPNAISAAETAMATAGRSRRFAPTRPYRRAEAGLLHQPG